MRRVEFDSGWNVIDHISDANCRHAIALTLLIIMTRKINASIVAFALGACIGAVVYAALNGGNHAAIAQTTKPEPDLPSLAAEIEAIKGKLPDQSHAMQDVSYHFSNLWFAAQEGNWPLAKFYLDETRSHLRWAVRIIPKRKDNAGQEIDLQSILQAFENSPWTQMHDAIAAKNKPEFEKKYKFPLESCYACHKAADKPFIHPQIPTRPETPIINFDAAAKWPL